MLLKNKMAVIYGGGGAIGGAVARVFAREGANVFIAGRTRERLDAVASDITAAGGKVEAAQLDVFNEREVEKHAEAVAAKAGGIDIALNAVARSLRSASENSCAGSSDPTRTFGRERGELPEKKGREWSGSIMRSALPPKQDQRSRELVDASGFRSPTRYFD